MNQNDALAHGLFGEFLQERGQNPESLAEFRRGAALDPLNAWRVSDVGFGFYTARQYEEALREFQKAFAVDPQRCVGSHRVGLGLWPKEDVR